MHISDGNGLEISLVYENGFPLVYINFNGFEGEYHRPTAEVVLNGIIIHEMFEHERDDKRWDDEELS